MAFSADELSSFKTMQSIVDFAAIQPEVSAVFYNQTGFAADSMPRALGIIPVEEFRTLVTELKVPVEGGDPRGLKLAEKVSLLLVGEACRACAGLLGSAPRGWRRGPRGCPAVPARRRARRA